MVEIRPSSVTGALPRRRRGKRAGERSGRERRGNAVSLRLGREQREPAIGQLDRGPAGTGGARRRAVLRGDGPAAELCIAARRCLQAERVGDLDLARGLALASGGRASPTNVSARAAARARLGDDAALGIAQRLVVFRLDQTDELAAIDQRHEQRRAVLAAERFDLRADRAEPHRREVGQRERLAVLDEPIAACLSIVQRAPPIVVSAP